MNFVPLHIYSGYSFLRSGLTVKKIVAESYKQGYFGVALTDLNSMTGYPELNNLVKKTPMLSCFGLDVEIDGTLLTLIIESEEGYINAIKINLAQSQGKLDREFLLGHQAGLNIILPSEYSRLRNLYKERSDDAVEYLFKLSKGIERFYVGIPYLPEEMEFVTFLRYLSESFSYNSVALPHFLYAKKEDAIVLEMVKAIQEDRHIEEKEKSGNNYILSNDTLATYFQDDEIFMTRAIAERSQFVFAKKRGGILKYPCPNGVSAREYLRKLSYDGLLKKKGQIERAYQDRLEYELNIIEKMGYEDYFLIVQDYVNWAKDNHISVGPGRGSGAGSLVSYSLNIVTPNPIEHGLLFERFLNPERKSMPDIDVDFADIKREDVVKYMKQKYGYDHVSNIVTIQTIGARQSIRDVGRIYQIEEREIDLLCKAIDNYQFDLGDAYRKSNRFKDLVDSDVYYLNIVKLARKIEGLPRQAGQHAAGIILNDKPLEDAIPVREIEGQGYVASYEMNYLEEQGFLKMDILALRNLTIVDNCLARIEANRGLKLDYAKLPYDDPDAIKLIASGQTIGLFQLESEGMKGAIKTIEPSSFEDVVALIALFRPGPMKSIPSFANRKKGLEPINYLSPELEEILSPTYGIIVYQEQIMQIARKMAGFSLGEADLLRRAISKKDRVKMQEARKSFIDGAMKKGHSYSLSDRTYQLIERFADYGFNKSHALTYAVLACQMAYLKYHYPQEFYASILDNFASATDPKFLSSISEIKKRGILLSLPTINEAGKKFYIKDDKLIPPLTMIKGMFTKLIDDIISEREAHGEFKDIFDFSKRITPFGLNVQTLVKLIDAGCFDLLEKDNRPSLRLSASSFIQYGEMFVGSDGQMSLLDFNIPKPLIQKMDDNLAEDLEAEKETLGIMISGSPLSLKKDLLGNLEFIPLSDLEMGDGKTPTLGVIKSVKVIITKANKQMAFLSVYDDTSEGEFIIFSDNYSKYYPLLKKGAVILIKYRKDAKGDSPSYIVDEINEVK